jgi:hypothetical protein
MPSILEVPPDIAAKLGAQAQEQGLSVDEYLRLLVERQEPSPPPSTALSPQEKARLCREWAASHSPDTSLLTDEAISRESIYGDHP